MFIFRNPPIMFETPDNLGSSGAPSAVAEPAPSGQPAATPDSDNGDFWGMFPGVPQEHRAILEPHLRQHVLPYVNRVEEQLAPFKTFTDAGLTAADTSGLLTFAQRFEENPKQVWLDMAQQLQGDGVLHESLDTDILRAIVNGEDIPDDEPDPDPQSQGLPAGLDPNVAAYIQRLEQQVNGIQGTLEERQQQEAQQREQQRLQQQDRLLNSQKSTILTNLEQAGMPVNKTNDPNQPGITEADVVAALIVAKGNPQNAEARLLNMRTAILGGFTQETTETRNGRDLDLSKGGPPAPRQTVRRGGNRDSGMDKARAGAEQFLKRNIAAEQ